MFLRCLGVHASAYRCQTETIENTVGSKGITEGIRTPKNGVCRKNPLFESTESAWNQTKLYQALDRHLHGINAAH